MQGGDGESISWKHTLLPHPLPHQQPSAGLRLGAGEGGPTATAASVASRLCPDLVPTPHDAEASWALLQPPCPPGTQLPGQPS